MVASDGIVKLTVGVVGVCVVVVCVEVVVEVGSSASALVSYMNTIVLGLNDEKIPPIDIL